MSSHLRIGVNPRTGNNLPPLRTNDMPNLKAGLCERCQKGPPESVCRRYCLRCVDFLDMQLQYDREHRQYLNDFCARAEAEAKAKYQRERLPSPANPVRTITVDAKVTVEIPLLPEGQT